MKKLVDLGNRIADTHMVLLSREILTFCSRIVLAAILVESI